MSDIVRFEGVGPDGFFDVEVGSAEHKRLLSNGHAPVAVEGDGEAGGSGSEDLEKLTNPQLEDKIREAGLEVPAEGAGTGKEGRVIKKDLVKVLEDHAAESEGSTLS